MGMDLSGRSPKSDAGKSFRNNIWWWHGIPYYIEANHPDLYAKATYWHSNDGDGLGARDSKKLAARLLADIESGKAKQFEDTWDGGRFSVENLRKFAEFVAASGGFRIY